MHTSAIVLEFDISHHVVVVLLGSHPSLATRKHATVEVVLATCHKCSSKLCLLFGPTSLQQRQLLFGPTSLQQRQLRKNHPLGRLVASCHCLN